MLSEPNTILTVYDGSRKKIENKQRKVVIKREKIWSFDICKRHNISSKKPAKFKKKQLRLE